MLVRPAALLRYVDVQIDDGDKMMGLEMAIATAPYITNARHPSSCHDNVIQLLEMSGHNSARRFYANVV
eukprot:7145676-Pyramimonas_sp.AAC.1